MSDTTLAIRFGSVEERNQWTQLCKELGQDENAFARRMMVRFVQYCREKGNGKQLTMAEMLKMVAS